MLMNWKQVEEKLQKIYDLLNTEVPKWREAEIMTDEIKDAGLPNGELPPEGPNGPQEDPHEKLLLAPLRDVKFYIRRNDKQSALKSLAKAQEGVQDLKSQD